MIFKRIVDFLEQYVPSMSRFVLGILMLILLSSGSVCAATISGNIYDLALQKEYDVVVEINTVPNQLIVSKDGYYSLYVNPGNYTLHAYTAASGSTESIIVSDDGDYVLDIVLEDKIPASLDGISLTDQDIDVSSSLPDGDDVPIYMWILVGSLLLIGISALGAYLLISHKKVQVKNVIHSSGKSEIHVPGNEDTDAKTYRANKIDMTVKDKAKDKAVLADEYESKVLSIIRKEKRTTQKDVRKEIPLSEAKISLILTDLEDKGKIRKIKKGRGNVLIFVKD